MDLLEIGMIGIAVMVAVNVIGPKIGIAAPLLLVLLGIGISFLPFVAPIDIKPEWILGGILPPLLYSSAVNMPAMDFRRDLRTISAFSVLLVIGSAVVIGYVMSRLIPDIDRVLVIIVRALFVAPSLWLLARRGRRGTAIRDKITSFQDRLHDGSLAPRVARPGRSEDEVDQHRADRTARISTSLTRRLADIDYLAAQAFGWREGVVLVWAGMRGAVTLAAAQSLPADTPQRSLLVLIAFVVAAGTLMVQGSTLGWLVRLLGLTGRDYDADLAAAQELRSVLLSEVSDRLARNELTKMNGDPFAPTTLDWGRKVIMTISVDPEERESEGEDLRSERGELRLAVIELQRTQLLAIRDLGTYPSAVLEEMLTQLDADQLSLELRSTS